MAAGANNPTAACGFLLEKQPSADVEEALLQPSQHAESSTSAQTEALLQPSQHAESGTSAQTEALLQPSQHAESGTSAQTEALLQPSQHAESGTSAQTEALLQPSQHAERGTSAQTRPCFSPVSMQRAAHLHRQRLRVSMLGQAQWRQPMRSGHTDVIWSLS